jgi:multicomponent Na+:H+ antiporter subunit E
VRAPFTRPLVYVATLTAVWLMLWDQITIANAVAGIVVGCLVLIVFPTERRVGTGRPVIVRPLAVVRLAGYVVVQLVVSNWLVAREILGRRSHIRTGIVAVPLRTNAPGMVTLLANIVALSPGTMTVEARAEPPTLYVHVLMLRDVQAAKREVAHLEHLLRRAFDPDADRIEGTVGS